MSSKLGTLTVDLLAKTGSFETDIKRAEKTTESSMRNIGERATAAGAVIGAALAAGAAAAAVAVKSSIDRADQLGEAAQKIGIPVEVLSSFEYAAKFGGLAFSQLEGGLKKLILAQRDIAAESPEMTRVFDQLKVDALNADGSLRATQDVLLDLADVFKNSKDGPEEAALALQVFGKSGADMVPFLNMGREGIVKLLDEAREFNQDVGTDTAEAAGRFNDQLDRLRAAATGAANGVTEKLLPGLVATNGPLDQLVDLLKDPGVQEGFANIIEGALSTATALARLASETANVVKFLAEETAFQVSGQATADDVVRLEKQRDQIKARLERNGDSILTTPLGFSPEKRAELEAELKGVEGLIADFYDGVEQRRKRAEALAAGANAPVQVNLTGLFGPNQPPTAPTGQSGLTAPTSSGSNARDFTAGFDALDESIRQVDDAAAAFQSRLVAYRDEVAGPLAQAQTAWAEREAELRDLAARGEVSTVDLADALGLLTAARERELDAIAAQLSPVEQVLEAQREELRLLGLTNVEREIENALKFAGAKASEAQRAEIESNAKLIEEARERIQFSDDIRRGFEDTFASIIDGSKSAKDALADLGSYITQLIAQRLSEQLVDSLFGEPGTNLGSGGGGGIGGFLSSALSSLFGGGRAAGGWVSPGKMYEVAENGPELLRVGNRQFLLPTATGGMVTPNARMGGGGGVVQNISVQGRMDNRTASQLAQESARAQRRAAARLGS